ncbi:MAG: CDP-alcohol phosphatidyltransferase family protein [Actinomycetota bacterium]|nr:CDP-alcohol phosphatidyltransferase family protein [Actinomycetota bacterium]
MDVGLYGLKPWFVARLSRAENVLVKRKVTPDALTYAAVASSCGAAGAIVAGAVLGVPLLWLLVAPLGLTRLALNALDGSLARRTGQTSPFGAALNEVCDRLSDAVVIVATATVAPVGLTLAAAVLALLVAVAGMSGAAAGGRRTYAGPMGKADRVAVLATGGVIAALAASPIAFTVALGVVSAGCVVTFFVRLKEVRRDAGCK